MQLNDLTDEAHWTNRYNKMIVEGGWHPADYNSRVIEYALLKALGNIKPRRILEIGCGNSVWLPYLAKLFDAHPVGVDFSPLGCSQAEDRLRLAGVSGEIYCRDFFTLDPAELSGHFDLVYSLGFVEHFRDLSSVVRPLSNFLAPGGVLFTEIPNMHSFHGCLSRAYQPSVYNAHVPYTAADLHESHKNEGLQNVSAKYYGVFSMDIVAWGIEPRWPRMEKLINPVLNRIRARSDGLLNRYAGLDAKFPWIAPFIAVSGTKEQ